jgi:hypothetical protein
MMRNFFRALRESKEAAKTTRQKVVMATPSLDGKKWSLILACGEIMQKRRVPFRPVIGCTGGAITGRPYYIAPKYVACSCPKCRRG